MLSEESILETLNPLLELAACPLFRGAITWAAFELALDPSACPVFTRPRTTSKVASSFCFSASLRVKKACSSFLSFWDLASFAIFFQYLPASDLFRLVILCAAAAHWGLGIAPTSPSRKTGPAAAKFSSLSGTLACSSFDSAGSLSFPCRGRPRSKRSIYPCFFARSSVCNLMRSALAAVGSGDGSKALSSLSWASLSLRRRRSRIPAITSARTVPPISTGCATIKSQAPVTAVRIASQYPAAGRRSSGTTFTFSASRGIVGRN